MINIPIFKTNRRDVNDAIRIAISDIISNIQLFKGGMLKDEKEVFIAGMAYDTPWTRDAAINTWNATGLLFPEISKNTLLSAIEEVDGEERIGDQYWDAIIWAIGAWYEYLYTGDIEFLRYSKKVIENTLSFFEKTEFTEKYNLFRGQACYGDGISCYPDFYCYGKSHANEFKKYYPEKAPEVGNGVPMHCLSTNCLYYAAYIILNKMAVELGDMKNRDYEEKALKLKEAINKHFWMEDKGYYRYIVDDFGNCDHQEGMGQSFVALFDIADKEKKKRLMENQYITEVGIPCVWPPYDRYRGESGKEYGRHSGTVWPHIEGFWGDAAIKNQREDLFQKEFESLTKHSVRDAHFYEIYHPETGLPYGGIQEAYDHDGLIMWNSQKKQTWSATAYLRLVLRGIMGMEFLPDGIKFSPNLPESINEISVKNLIYQDMNLDISIKGSGNVIKSFKINGQEKEEFISSKFSNGNIKIEIDITK